MVDVAVTDPVYRSHQTVLGAWYLSIGRTRNRFDDPVGVFGVCYAAASPEAAFAETFLRKPQGQLVSNAELIRRSLTRFRFGRMLRLVDLTGRGLAGNHAIASVTAGDTPAAQLAAAELYHHRDAPDGIRYRVRHDDDHYGYTLFDRAGTLEVIESLPWADRSLTTRMADRYRLAI